MLDVFNIPQPQNCDIQNFVGQANANVTNFIPRGMRTWNKPRGVSNIYIMLIGAGGNGVAGSSGGGSGAVTVWYGAAQNVPDSLLLYIPAAGFSGGTYIWPQSLQSAFTTSNYLLLANTGVNGTGGAATVANNFSASGFYQSVAGQNGAATNVAASATTFLSGGAQSTNNDVIANYGYDTTQNNAADGYFLLQPIIVGVGGGGNKNGGIGCGGGGATSGGVGSGGPGFVLIASW